MSFRNEAEAAAFVAARTAVLQAALKTPLGTLDYFRWGWLGSADYWEPVTPPIEVPIDAGSEEEWEERVAAKSPFDEEEQFRGEFTVPLSHEGHLKLQADMTQRLREIEEAHELSKLNREADSEPDFELEEPPVIVSELSAGRSEPQMIRVDDYHIREVALHLAVNDRVDGNQSAENMVKRAKAFYEFLQGGE